MNLNVRDIVSFKLKDNLFLVALEQLGFFFFFIIMIRK